MTDFEVLEDYVAGNDLDVGPKAVSGIDPMDPLVKAWLTIKNLLSDADPGVLQKVITTTLVPGTGQITDDGAAAHGNGTGQVLFQLTAADTTALGAIRRYVYDIKVKTAAGKLYTAVWGPFQLRPTVTTASS